MSDNFLLSVYADFSARKRDYFRPSQSIHTGSGALLASYSKGKGHSNPPCAFLSRKRTLYFMHDERHERKLQMRSALVFNWECLSSLKLHLAKFQEHRVPAEQDCGIKGVLLNAATFRIGSGWSPSSIVLNKHTPLLTINRRKNFSLTQRYYINNSREHSYMFRLT